MEVSSRGGNISSSSSLSSSPKLSPLRMRPRFMCRRLDKLCCLVAGYFPLLFVYGLTSWAAYTEIYSISWRAMGGYQGMVCGTLGGLLYGMLIWSYTHTVFTKPGSPIDNKHGYSYLPTSDPAHSTSSVTVKSDGKERFCKKCQCRKPDRAHHCSSCRTCVLKMDHHCPWLANCLGLYNYKAFLLFLIYTSVFCLVCFFVSLRLVYVEIFSESIPGEENSYGGNIEDLTPVNWVLLVVISGIIGLVLSGFTIWHLVLTASNMTTIESLEKVRYNAPSFRSVAPPPGAHLVDSFNSSQQENYYEFRRYNEYLLEESSKKLPHAFNLGRGRNFAQVFGGRDKMWFWCLPMFTGSGDGWKWETSEEWRNAAESIRLERERWAREQTERERAAGWGGYDAVEEQEWGTSRPGGVFEGGGNPNGLIKYAGGQRQPSKVERLLGRPAGSYTDAEGVPLRNLSKGLGFSVDDDDVSDDNDEFSKPLPSPPPLPPPLMKGMTSTEFHKTSRRKDVE